jgi:hypothetical protein
MDVGRNVVYSAHASVAQLDRASASGAEGYRFEPCRGYCPLDLQLALHVGVRECVDARALPRDHTDASLPRV